MSKSLLHICGGVSVQKLYGNIFNLLAKKNYLQDIYIPCNNDDKVGRNQESISGVSYHYYVVRGRIARILFYPKIQKHYLSLKRRIDISSISYCFAYTAMTDGALALKLKKKHKVPYSVFVRNTDINFFFKYFFFLRPLFFKVLSNADHINFPNPSYKSRLFNSISPEKRKLFADKCHVLPNGIDDFWHRNGNNNVEELNLVESPLRLIFVGKLEANKNVLTLIDVIKRINQTRKAQLTIIGAFGDPDSKYSKELSMHIENSKYVNYVGPVANRTKLMDYYRASDIFIMPSFTETFGLVYVEAMSQRLPIIYTKGEGIDGFFDDGIVGYGIHNPLNVLEIVDRIFQIVDNYDFYSKNALSISKRFNWNNVINEYLIQIRS